MNSSTRTKLTFIEFLEQCSDKEIYELVNGEIIKVKTTRTHKNISRLLMFNFNNNSEHLGLDYIRDFQDLDFHPFVRIRISRI